MAIRSFDVGPLRGLHHAAATDLPNLVGISGPNGAGKSTLLELLYERKPAEMGTEILYVGPHRTWRSNPINEVMVLSMGMEFGDVLKRDAIPGIPYTTKRLRGLAGSRRIGSSSDDAQAYVKAAIIRIRNKKQRLITKSYDAQGGQVQAGTVPDLLGPFRELIKMLLPHLEWVGVNDKDVNDIKCEFRTVGNSDMKPFDIDNLSSGEKEAIALFLPFVEREVSVLEGEEERQYRNNIVPVTVLIDEPELHLHALLQLNALEYMRRLAYEGRVQFIFTLHSPSLLDALTPEELFLLAPRALAADNQLSRLVDSNERLEAVRAVTGSTHMLTRCKPIVIIEGESDDSAHVTDERIMKIVMPEASHWALIPGKGKSQVKTTVTTMRNSSELHLPGMPVFGLVDDDQGTSSYPDYIIPWPVAMIENLLLDEEAIYKLIEPHTKATGLRSLADVRKSLLDIAAAQVAEEQRLRLQGLLPQKIITLNSTDHAAIEAEIKAAIDSYKESIRLKNPASLQQRVETEVQAIVDAGAQLERFHGKNLLLAWHGQYFKTVMKRDTFLVELARYVSTGARITRLTAIPLSRIKLYFPKEAISLLQKCDAGGVRDALLTECTNEVDLWKQGTPNGQSRELLRRRIVQYAREGSMDEATKAGLIKAAMEIGTP